MDLSRITTRDILAVMTVGAALIFNGISLTSGRPPDAATMTLAGAVVGFYFKPSGSEVAAAAGISDGPLAPPSIPDGNR